jgi:hypothetical protein
MYCLLMNTPTLTHNMLLWKLKLPLKIKIFLWYLGRGVTLTKVNLAKRGWTGSIFLIVTLSGTFGVLFTLL